jgi:hypothetical protein
MKGQISTVLAVVAVITAYARRPALAQPRFWDRDLTIEGSRGAERCSDLRPRARGELAQATENFTLSKSQAPALELRGRSHTSFHIRGWDRADYSVEVCKFAAAASRSEADRLLRSIDLTRSGARFTVTGPDYDRQWEAVLFVHAPKDASVDLESGNGPVAATGVSGKLNVRAVNGPLSLDNCSGTIDAETLNGPISVNGGSGEVHLRASNGPISLTLADPVWNGSQLEASTENGPLSVTLPAGFQSGLRLETSGHGPIGCDADICRNARTEGSRFFPRLVEAGSGDVIRLSTHNGPVSVSNRRRHARSI